MSVHKEMLIAIAATTAVAAAVAAATAITTAAATPAAAATTAAAIAATTATVTAATAAALAGFGLVHGQRSAAEVRSVKCVNGPLGFAVVFHFHEAETARS